MATRKIKILGTVGCHLCDEALAVIEAFNALMAEHDFSLQVSYLDIASDARLVEDYGRSIPVLIDELSGAELFWPFDPESLYVFLRACDG